MSLTRADTGLRRLAATSAASVHLALDLGIGANVLESSGVFVVAVDTRKFTTVCCGNTLNVDITLALRRAL